MKKSLMALSLMLMAGVSFGKTIALVDGDKIDDSEVAEYLLLLKNVPETVKLRDEELRKLATSLIVKNRILVKEAKKRGLDKKDEYKQNIDIIKKRLESEKIAKPDDNDKRWQVTKDEMLIGMLKKDIFDQKKGDENLAKKIYDDKFKEYEGTKLYVTRRIVTEKKADAEAAIKELKKGNFDDVQKKYTIMKNEVGKDVAFNSLDLEKRSPELEKLLKSIKKGEYNKTPFEFENVNYVIKVTSIQDFKLPAYDEVKKDILNEVRMAEAENDMMKILDKSKLEFKDPSYDFTKGIK